MAFIGDLEHLHIVDVIQLLHTTRKSGIFSVTGSKGESTISFHNGSIIDATYDDSKLRLGSVLLKLNSITIDDLIQAYGAMQDASQSGRSLISTLVQTGKLKREEALKGLKKLVEITIVELMDWRTGAFTIDTDAMDASSRDGLTPGEPEGDLSVDAQMILMDALRIFDERQRDRQSGKSVPSYEEFAADILPEEQTGEEPGASSAVTADVLGLADIDRLVKKIPRPVTDREMFDPVEIHRRKIQELLADYSPEEQESFFAFLKSSQDGKATPDAVAKQACKAIVLYSGDKLLRHAILSICKDEGILVFTADSDKDVDRMVSQSLSSMKTPIVVLDSPAKSGEGFAEEKIVRLRNSVMGRYPAVSVIQLAAVQEGNFILASYKDGVRAVLPKPLQDIQKATYVQDSMRFLEGFKSYIKGLPCGQDDAEGFVKKLKDGMLSFRGLTNPSEAALVILAAVSDMFERAVTFLVRSSELVGERAIGVSSDKSMGPTPADRLKIPLSQPSAFRDVLEKQRIFYGENGDDLVMGLFREIGAPKNPALILLPLICDRKVVAIVYGDFGAKPAAPVRLDILEILAEQAGIVMENALFRRQAAKADQSRDKDSIVG